MRARSMVENETATEADTDFDADVWTRGPDGELIPNYDLTFPTINEGEVVSGRVVRVDKDEVLVDIGYKSEGVIPVSELSIRRSVDPGEEVQIGDEVDALVLTKEDAEGRLILSKKRARFEMAWKRIERAAETGEPGEARPADQNVPVSAQLCARLAALGAPGRHAGRVATLGALSA